MRMQMPSSNPLLHYPVPIIYAPVPPPWVVAGGWWEAVFFVTLWIQNRFTDFGATKKIAGERSLLVPTAYFAPHLTQTLSEPQYYRAAWSPTL